MPARDSNDVIGTGEEFDADRRILTRDASFHRTKSARESVRTCRVRRMMPQLPRNQTLAIP